MRFKTKRSGSGKVISTQKNTIKSVKSVNGVSSVSNITLQQKPGNVPSIPPQKNKLTKKEEQRIKHEGTTPELRVQIYQKKELLKGILNLNTTKKIISFTEKLASNKDGINKLKELYNKATEEEKVELDKELMVQSKDNYLKLVKETIKESKNINKQKITKIPNISKSQRNIINEKIMKSLQENHTGKNLSPVEINFLKSKAYITAAQNKKKQGNIKRYFFFDQLKENREFARHINEEQVKNIVSSYIEEEHNPHQELLTLLKDIASSN